MQRPFDPADPMATWSVEQRDALRQLYDRNNDGAATLEMFEARAFYSFVMDCLMVPWCGMQIGIERDGYTHS